MQVHDQNKKKLKMYFKTKTFAEYTSTNRPLSSLWECSQSGVQNNKIVLQKRKFHARGLN